MTKPKEARSRHVRQLALVERFQTVLYPFDLAALMDRLPAEGWLVAEGVQIRDDEIRVPAPVRGNVRVQIDQANKTLGVSGKQLAETVAAYRELRTLAQSLAGLTALSPSETHYVELRYIGTVKGDTPVTEVFQRWWSSENGRIAKFGGWLSSHLPSDSNTMLPYGVRFASAGLSANRPNWAELTIGPANIGDVRDYHFDLIFRNQDSEITEDVAEHADELIDNALTEIEHG